MPFVSRRLWSARIPFETIVKICENTVWEGEEGKFSFGSYARCHTLKNDIRCLKCTKNDAKEEREKIGMSLLKMPFFHDRKSRLHDEEIKLPSKRNKSQDMREYRLGRTRGKI